jgi:hypothetical protein
MSSDESPQKSVTASQIEMVLVLRTHDHEILSRDSVEEYARVFGTPGLKAVEMPPQYMYSAGNSMGLGAHCVAEQLCHHLGVKYAFKNGIGSSLRECCDRLLEHLHDLLASEDGTVPGAVFKCDA